MPEYEVPVHSKATRWVIVDAPNAREAARRVMAPDSRSDPSIAHGAACVEYGDEWAGRPRRTAPRKERAR